MAGRSIPCLLLPLAALVLLSGCTESPPEGGRAVDPLAAPDCTPEAERLLSTVTVFPQPTRETPELTVLEPGRFIYRCRREGAWLAIMFPAAGEAVDCASRAPARACAVGWVRESVRTEIIG